MKMRHTAIAVALAASGFSAQADLARVGPSNVPSPPGYGFPLWYQDLNGTVLDLCLPDANDPGAAQQNACLLVGPGLPDPPYSFPNNFPDEAFYFNATSVMDMPAGKRATLVTALEAAFSVGPVVIGDQITFTRIRVFAGVPEPGTYTVTHPYGVETFPVDSVSAGNRDIVFSEDVGVARGIFDGALKSRVGPFLQRADSLGAPLGAVTVNGAQFLSDGAATEFVTGSPFGTNYFEICGVRTDGTPIILGDQGASGMCIRSDQFSLMGRLHDFVANPIPSPLEIYNSFYKRDADGTQVDVYARNIKALPSQPNPSLTAAAANIKPVKMIPFGPAGLGQFYTQGLVDPSGALPGPVSVINSADTPSSKVTKDAVDIVTAASANYDYNTDTLTVTATSSDKGFGTDLPPKLSLDENKYPGHTAVAANNANDPAEMILTATGVGTPPDTVTVLSSANGSGTFPVTRNQATGANIPGPGVPLALDDSATAEANGAAVEIQVAENDIVNSATPITSLQLVGPAIPAGSGTASADGAKIIYTPGSVNGVVTFQYTASNSVGKSNAATVTVTVIPSAAGPAPIVNPDGPVNATVSQSVVINVLANDSGNGGTLNPASVTLSNVTGGTAAADATGKVTFTAGTAAGNFGFDYTVANDNGQVSPTAHVAVTVVNPENIQITTSQCKVISTTAGEWRVAGTSSVQTNNSIQLYLTASVPADLSANKLGAAAPVVAGVPNGTWEVRLRPGPACRTPISLISSATSAKRENIAVAPK
ncbi:Ig-like domain-containing protein [Methylobacter sp. sgz302048]|uniref:Ig-like domain-containing protein n=1 Tax=Methylobacter sp. sgz302048 TaxID=3455945 RepID=UPI003FA0D7AF